MYTSYIIVKYVCFLRSVVESEVVVAWHDETPPFYGLKFLFVMQAPC